MTPEQIKKGGWIKHDKSFYGPECYNIGDLVDLLSSPNKIHIGLPAERAAWEHVTHYRRHYSERDLLVMARDELQECSEHETWCSRGENCTCGGYERMKTLTLINERLGDE